MRINWREVLSWLQPEDLTGWLVKIEAKFNYNINKKYGIILDFKPKKFYGWFESFEFDNNNDMVEFFNSWLKNKKHMVLAQSKWFSTDSYTIHPILKIF